MAVRCPSAPPCGHSSGGKDLTMYLQCNTHDLRLYYILLIKKIAPQQGILVCMSYIFVGFGNCECLALTLEIVFSKFDILSCD